MVCDSNPYWSKYKIKGTIEDVYVPFIYVTWDNGKFNSYSLEDVDIVDIVDKPIIDVDELFEGIDV
jgi:hypothetical protein